MLSNLESDLDESTIETDRQRGREVKGFNLLQILSNLESDLDESKIERDRQTKRERERESQDASNFYNVIQS